MLPIITVFCPFTRLEPMERWFEDLASTDLLPEKTNLAFIIDVGGDLGPKIYDRIMAEMNRTEFRKFVILRNYEHEVPEVNIPMRRQRIAEIHNQAKELVRALDGDFVLGLEDDTVFTNLSVRRLYAPFIEDGEKSVGLVSAYEAGRWHNKIIGIWNFDNVNDPQSCWTMLPGQGYEEIDATGFYCFLTPLALYKEYHFSTELWQPWGPDVNYGLWLREMGLFNFVDWTQSCGHIDNGIIITPNNNLYVEHFVKNNTINLGYPVWERQKHD